MRLLCAAEDMGRAQQRFLDCQAHGRVPERALEKEWAAYGPSAFMFEVIARVPKKQGQSPEAYYQEIEALREYMAMQPVGCG